MTTHLQRLADSVNPHNRDELMARETKFLTKIPTGGLVLKLVQFGKGKSYLLMDYFSYLAGPSAAEDTRSRACLKSLNQSVSPEKDKFWELKKIIKDLKSSGTATEEEIARYESMAKKFKPTTRAWVLAVTPDSPTLMAVRLPRAVIDDIFGVDDKSANEYRPAQKGLLNKMLEKGRSPFDLRSDLGWIKITTSGKGIATRYQIVELVKEVTEEQGSKTVTYTEPERKNVHPGILELTTEDIPNVYKYEEKKAFTLEESMAFVASMGTDVPARFLIKKKGDQAAQAGNYERKVVEQAPVTKSSVAKYAVEDEDDYVDEVPF